MVNLFALLGLAALVTTSDSALLSNAFGSNMVLQAAPYKASLYGWTTGGASVTVSIPDLKFTQSAVADGNGKWKLTLPAVKPSFTAYDITVTCPNVPTVKLTNVLFGDVYVCGGQSNMQFTVSEAYNSTTEIQNADKYPNIRVFTVGQKTQSNKPLNEFAEIEQLWSVASAAAIGGDPGTFFSAVCWFYGRDIFDRHQIPIGLISSNWGGTAVETWMSSDALHQCNLSPVGATPVMEGGLPGDAQIDNSALYNAMIYPLLDMQVRGAIWYQGEANSGNPDLYKCTFPAMISDWRAKWGESAQDYIFLFVQLAPDDSKDEVDSWPLIRLAQTAALQLPYVGMAVAMDLGDNQSPWGTIHPRDKQDVGVRLDVVAENYVYNNKVTYLGPTLANLTLVSPPPSVQVQVDYLPSSTPLLMHQAPICPDGVDPSLCGSSSIFEVGTDDNTWHPADYKIASESTIMLSVSGLPETAKATGVRHAYAAWPLCTVYNEAGLPAPPFLEPLA